MSECSKCGSCCRWIEVKIRNLCQDQDRKDYLLTHGCKVKRHSVVIPTVCKHLKDNLCDLHDTELKPRMCRDFKGQSKGYYVPPECTMNDKGGEN